MVCGTPYFGSAVDTYVEWGLTHVYQTSLWRSGPTDLSGLSFKRWRNWHNESCPGGNFDYPAAVFFPYIFFSVVKRNPGYNMQRRSTVRPPLSTADSLKCLIFAVSVTLDMNNLCSNHRKPSSRSSASGLPQWPTASWAMILHWSTLMSSTATGNSLR